MATAPRWMIYGANGYTGELVAREAVARGMRPVLAGRRREPLEALAGELGLEARVFAVADPRALSWPLEGLGAVLNCAGPFVRTARPLVDACLAAGCHYLDVTGEIEVFEEILARTGEAEEAGVALIPGVGMDVVPTDCLAARLATALPDATHLELAIGAGRGSWSRGTLRTMVEAFPEVATERRDGRLVRLRPGEVTRRIELPSGTRTAVAVRWGDVSTAYHTTGIPNVRVYFLASARRARRLRRSAVLFPLLGLRPIKRALQWWIGRTVTGPTREARRTVRTTVWGEVRNAAGERVTGTLEIPESYTFTALAAVECGRRALAGEATPGAWTPAGAFGPGLVESIPDVELGPLG